MHGNHKKNRISQRQLASIFSDQNHGLPKTLGGSFHIKHKTDAQLDFLKGLSTIKNSKIHIKIMNMYEFYIQTATMNCRIW